MLFKRGSTISAAEGGCQAEVGGMSCTESDWCNNRENNLNSCMFDGQCWIRRMHGRYAISWAAPPPL
jgi:hypothetical protein